MMSTDELKIYKIACFLANRNVNLMHPEDRRHYIEKSTAIFQFATGNALLNIKDKN